MENNRDPLGYIEQQHAKEAETKRTVGTSTRALEGNFRPAGKKKRVFHSKSNKHYQLGRTYAMRDIEPELDSEWSREEDSDFLAGYNDTRAAMEKEAIKAKDKKSFKKTLIFVGLGVGGFALFVVWIDGKGRGGK